jgi:hypothetical protein
LWAVQNRRVLTGHIYVTRYLCNKHDHRYLQIYW